MSWLLEVALRWTLGCVCLFEWRFSQDLDPCVGNQYPRLSFLESFFFFFSWHGEAVLSSDCCQCPFPLAMQGGSLFSQLSPTFIICQLVRMAILTGGTWFLVVLVGIPPVIFRDVEQLVLWPFVCLFVCFLFLKGVRTFYLLQAASWKSVMFRIDFCNTHPRTFPAGSGH